MIRYWVKHDKQSLKDAVDNCLIEEFFTTKKEALEFKKGCDYEFGGNHEVIKITFEVQKKATKE